VRIHDDELQRLIGAAVDPAQLTQFDAGSIALESRRRSIRRRRTLLACVGIFALALAASAVIVGLPGRTTAPTAQPPATSTPAAIAPPAGRPPCTGPGLVLPGNPVRYGEVLRSLTLGESVTIEGVIESHPHVRLLRAELIIAKPGTRPMLGPPESVHPAAVSRTENHLTRGAAVTDVVAGGQRLSVTFQPTEPGRYPVFFMGRFTSSADCTAPAPPAGTPIDKSGVAMAPLGDIVVQ
jgi:hypothetical protein